MTYKEAVEELKSYKDIYLELENLYELLERMNNSKNIKAIRYDRVNVQISCITDMSASLTKIETIRSLYTERVNKNLDKINEIEEKIEKVDNNIYRIILRNKYIQDQKLEALCDSMNRSIRYLQKLHGIAISEYSKI